jgi:hypothetical protein
LKGRSIPQTSIMSNTVRSSSYTSNALGYSHSSPITPPYLRRATWTGIQASARRQTEIRKNEVFAYGDRQKGQVWHGCIVVMHVPLLDPWISESIRDISEHTGLCSCTVMLPELWPSMGSVRHRIAHWSCSCPHHRHLRLAMCREVKGGGGGGDPV